MTPKGRARPSHALVVLGLALALAGLHAGCSLGNLTPNACASSTECAAVFGTGSECVDGYCTGAVQCSTNDDCPGGSCVDGYCSSTSCESAVDGRPCWACTPTTRDQFLNGCTNATCVPFDNGRVTKLPADGTLPPVP